MRTPILLVSLLLALLLGLLAGCGEETGAASGANESATPASPTATPSETESSPQSETADPLPACATVWVDGATLPDEYAGCSRGSRVVEPREWPCAFGGPVVTYANRFYAVRGHRVNATQRPLAQDPDWQTALASCRG